MQERVLDRSKLWAVLGGMCAAWAAMFGTPEIG